MPAAEPAIMLIVRGLRSKLPEDELQKRYRERMPEFRKFSGLVQKYYARDEATGDISGVYFFDSEESLNEYMESDLRKTIPSAYELTDPPQIERFRIFDVLRR